MKSLFWGLLLVAVVVGLVMYALSSEEGDTADRMPRGRKEHGPRTEEELEKKHARERAGVSPAGIPVVDVGDLGIDL
jgi:hypothetical protein